MQPSKLITKVSSKTVAGYNSLLSKGAAKRVYAFVEGNEDIPFWHIVLKDYASEKFEFKIRTPSRKGKENVIAERQQVLALKDQSGPFLICCVDSDYDYILPERTEQAKFINTDPYIFQTYSYSIENLQCFSESLHDVCVQATKNHAQLINFNELLKTFSKIIFRLFLWNLYFRKNNDHVTFTISDFCEVIKLTGRIDVADKCVSATTSLKTRVDTKIFSLERDHPLAIKEVDKIAANMERIGVNEDNTYLFIHGHTLKENVVLNVLNRVCALLTKEKFKEIINNAAHKKAGEDDMNQYRNQKQDISSVLNSNTEYKNCFLYKKIKADFDNYIATMK